MNLFVSDLDNTLIYSYKHDIGKEKRNVEIYQERKISFISEKTYELLKQVCEKITFVPVTTRSVEQYKRIDLGIGPVKYALTCNGGVLLINGEKDEQWYEESLKLIEPSIEELKKGMDLLSVEDSRSFEIRFIENLFVFTKCNKAEEVVQDLRTKLNGKFVDVFNNGSKVYIVPKNLDKGTAITRLKEYLSAEKIISAGDSEFDVSMLKVSDAGIIPLSFPEKINSENIFIQEEKKELFSDFVLRKVLDFTKI